MKTLVEYSVSEAIPISVSKDPLFSNLLKREIKLRNFNENELRFSSNGFCGILTLGEVTHYITPQFGSEMLTTLLPISAGIHTKRFESKSSLSDNSIDFADGIASIFLTAFSEIEKTGIRNNYQNIKSRGLISTGSLVLEESLAFLNSGLGLPTWKSGLFTKKTELNRCIKFIFTYLIQNLKLSKPIQSKIREIIEIFPFSVDIHIPDYNLLLNSLDRTTIQYQKFLEFAAALSFGANQSAGTNKSICCLFESWRIFQQAVKVVVNEICVENNLRSNINSTLAIQYTEGQKSLDPDLLIFDGTPNLIALGDVKYIENDGLDLPRDNMFQLNAYMSGYNIQRGFLLYPTTKDFSYKKYALRWGKEIVVYRIPVNSSGAFKEGLELVLKNEAGLGLNRSKSG